MMFKVSVIAIVATTLSSILTNSIVNAHMAMCEPAPRYSNYGGSGPTPPSGQTYDYNIKAPIGTSDTINQPLCKHTVPFDTPVATWSAGETVSVKFQDGGAAHNGGHCQFSISYDNGKTFVVIKNVFKNCFTNGNSSGNTASVLSYDIALPSQLPSGRAVFSWTWVNSSGNREFYMNCADVQIKGNGNSLTGKQMLIANYGPQYPTIPEFGANYNTGLDLYNAQPEITVYGNGKSNYSAQPPSSSPVTNNSTNNNNGNTYQNIPTATPNQSNNQSINNNNAYQTVSPVSSGQGNNQYNNNSNNYQIKPVSNNNNNNAPVPRLAINTNVGTDDCSTPSMPDSCKAAAMRCSTSSNGFEVCNQGTWEFIPCSQGTKCILSSNGFPDCTW